MTGEQIPKARVRRRRLFRLVWVVPVIALGVAAYLCRQHMRSIGPEISITFPDAGGLRVGQTPINYRGVQIGEVIGIGLGEDRKQALVKARLHKSAAPIASEGARFWIVRPQLGLNQVTGLSTVLSGPEINVIPGNGEKLQKHFVGLDGAPVALGVPGLRLVLRAERPKGVRVNTPVNYRGVEVGMVHRIELAPNSASADIHILIHTRYANLVRAGSAFWNTSGVQATGGILKGSRSRSSRCARSTPAPSSSPRRARRRRAPSPARCSSCTTSRKTSGWHGRRRSRWVLHRRRLLRKRAPARQKHRQTRIGRG